MTVLRFSSDGNRLASGGDDSVVVVWDARTGALLDRLTGHQRSITDAAWMVAGKKLRGRGKLASGTRARGGSGTGISSGRMLVTSSMDSSVVVFEELAAVGEGGALSYKAIVSLDWLASPFLCLAYTKAKRLLVGGRGDGRVQVWDAAAPNLGLLDVCTFDSGCSRVDAIEVSQDGELIATGGSDWLVHLWNRQESDGVVTYEVDPAVRGAGHKDALTHMVMSPDGNTLLTSR